MKPMLLRLHRWTTLVFALPLLVIIVTGLILSVAPIQRASAIVPGSLPLTAVETALGTLDAAGEATALLYDPVTGVLAVRKPDGMTRMSMETGERLEQGDLATTIINGARGIHERLVFGLGWLVIASTIAMLVLIVLGVLMGLPRMRNTVSGWHQGGAWFLLPLVVISPLSGLLLAFGPGSGFSSAPPARSSDPVPMLQAVRLAAQSHDLATLKSIIQRGPRQIALFTVDGTDAAFNVTPDGLTPLPTAWPRLIHEGTWLGIWAGVVNVLISLVLLGLLGTGLTIWARRKFRKPQRRRQQA